MNWYKTAQAVLNILPYLNKAGITGEDKEETIKVLNGQANSKLLIQKFNNNQTYYWHDKDKIINFLNIVANYFPNINVVKFWQQSIDGSSKEGYFIVNQNTLDDLLNALKTSTTQGMTQQYHRQMGEIYGYKPEEIEDFVSKEPQEIALPEKSIDPSLIIQDIRTNQQQKII